MCRLYDRKNLRDRAHSGRGDLGKRQINKVARELARQLQELYINSIL